MTLLVNGKRAAILVASAVMLCAMASLGTAEVALALAPIALLVSSLLGGCYPGEGTIAWIATKVGQRGPRACAEQPFARPATPVVSPTHGGLLIARSLCGRAPPLLTR